MLKKVLIGVGAVVVLFLGFVAMQPGTFKVERSATVAAPADVVFAEINDLHKWSAWSPWEKIDPAMEKKFEGPEMGKGAIYTWKSANENVGSGRMTIEESVANEKVAIKLEFMEPWQSQSAVWFTTKADGANTNVTWAIEGPMNFAMKAMCVFNSMDNMMGPDFEKGLADLKKVSEARQVELAAAAAAKAAADAEAAKASEAAAAAAPKKKK